jgi:hypothetical protein
MVHIFSLSNLKSFKFNEMERKHKLNGKYGNFPQKSTELLVEDFSFSMGELSLESCKKLLLNAASQNQNPSSHEKETMVNQQVEGLKNLPRFSNNMLSVFQSVINF